MTKQELLIASEALDGLTIIKIVLSAVFGEGISIVDIEEKSPIGKIERLVDLFYEYIPVAKKMRSWEIDYLAF